MIRTILVPVDFTPVTYNALHYACELSKLQPTKILAVHLLDNNLLVEMQSLPDNNLAMRKLMERMYNEIKEKTINDLNNFIFDLKSEYGDIIYPILAHGSIYEAFDDLAATHDTSLIIMGTHGITGMQHVAGSRAFKVVSSIPYPCLVVQNKKYLPAKSVYYAFKNADQFERHAGQIDFLINYFPGKMIINILDGGIASLPAKLTHLADRINIIGQKMLHENVVEAAEKEAADVLGICITDDGNIDFGLFGMAQDKIIANKNQLPVLCLAKRI